MKKLYTILILSLSLEAQTLHETIEYSIEHNYQLQILEEEVSIVNEQKEIESFWDNPILKVGINDIQGDHPLSRNLESMQNQYVTLSQTIPLSNKLEVASQLENEKKRVIELRATYLKVEIASVVREAFIEANSAQKRLTILDNYIAFLKKPLQLLINLSSVEENSVDKYIKTQLLQKSYQLQRESALQLIKIAKENIELVGNLKIDSFSDEVLTRDYTKQSLNSLLNRVEQTPKLAIATALKDVANQGVVLAQEKEQADLTLTAGYYQRFDRNDYISLGVAYPLYTHGKEQRERVQAMKRTNIQELSYKQVKVEIEQKLKIALHKLKALNQELKILEDTQAKIMQLIANAKSELSVGGSLVRYYELFTKKTNSALEINKKRLSIALIENQITKILGDIE